MKLRSRIMLYLLSSVSMQAASQTPDSNEEGTIAEAESRFLFINMLEFIGEFETESGEWVSPELLGNEVFADLDNIESDTPGSRVNEQRVLSTSDDE